MMQYEKGMKSILSKIPIVETMPRRQCHFFFSTYTSFQNGIKNSFFGFILSTTEGHEGANIPANLHMLNRLLKQFYAGYHSGCCSTLLVIKLLLNAKVC